MAEHRISRYDPNWQKRMQDIFGTALPLDTVVLPHRYMILWAREKGNTMYPPPPFLYYLEEYDPMKGRK